uniref:Protein kinase domain-containing protein n=1 Tax=Ananas comosus var. bracteatus TaxID=296719 RepID=A0A6V7NYH3_ANACO|nr:unnamed protein product [Ananas comosus var. bracteatus]
MEFSLSVVKIVYLLLAGCTLVPRYSCASDCGNIPNISYPFCLQNDLEFCGDSPFQLFCEKNQTTIELFSKKYFVESIIYDDYSIRIVDPDIFGDNCSYVPHYFSSVDVPPYFSSDSYLVNRTIDGTNVQLYYQDFHTSVFFLNCSVLVNDSLYIATVSCRNASNKDASYSYVLLGSLSVGDLHKGCYVADDTYIDFTGDYESQNLSYSTIRGLLEDGITLNWSPEGFILSTSSYSPPFHSSRCFRNLLSAIARGYFLLGRTILGVLCFSAFLIYKLRSRHLAMDHKIEEFLSEYKNHMPKRYSYWELFRMTNRFKEKLGQEDFVNEVATIGRIHHMHVVQLTGFCAEGSKRALIYEFMPNGSLDKFLSSQIGDNDRLGWKKLHEIALGIARGIEYLHRGCSMKILHFDIKPHNILLDENLVPKVSDFGLAKFYPIEESIVSLTAVRGTIGYIAPELFYRRVGNISYKSDVYSYGMLLMEMAGRRKNILDQHANSTSQIYFPSWIYDQLTLGDLGLGEDVAEDEKDTFKRLVIVALWCIQMKPVDRPSMSRVVEMLEGSAEHLEMPRKPFLASPDRWGHVDDQASELGASNSFERPSSESILSPR